jgi:hypothetical protein
MDRTAIVLALHGASSFIATHGLEVELVVGLDPNALRIGHRAQAAIWCSRSFHSLQSRLTRLRMRGVKDRPHLVFTTLIAA